MKVAAVVLAAGASSRMGRPKALLPCRGKSFLRTVLDTLAEAGIAETRVVLGHGAAEIASAERLPSELCVSNPRFEDGMLSSVRCGIRALPPGLDAFFLWPVDHPLVRAATITRLEGAHAASAKGIVLPKHEGRRGHPPLFAARLAGALLTASDAVGARAVLLAHPDEIEEVEVDDPGVIADVDTPESYRRLVEDDTP
jgi:CTP:molybdopterin cytidylyltransferase MocA